MGAQSVTTGRLSTTSQRRRQNTQFGGELAPANIAHAHYPGKNLLAATIRAFALETQRRKTARMLSPCLGASVVGL